MHLPHAWLACVALALIMMARVWQTNRNKVRLQTQKDARAMAQNYTRESLARAMNRNRLDLWFLQCFCSPRDLTTLSEGCGCWISIPCMAQGAKTNEILIDPTSKLTISNTWTPATPVLVYRDTGSGSGTYYALYFGKRYGLSGNGEPSQNQTFRIFTIGSTSSIPLEFAYPTNK